MSPSMKQINRILCGLLLASVAMGRPLARELVQQPTDQASADSIRVYVGTYTSDGKSRGIYLLRFDQSTGHWTSGPVLAATAANPSFLALHPNGRYVYAVNELQAFHGRPTGSVSAFDADRATGGLTLLNTQPSEGADPCHLAVEATGRNLIVANYTGGSVAVLPVLPDGRLQPASDVRRRTGSGPNRDRQEGPHPHAVLFDPKGRRVLSADLGTDRVMVEPFDPSHGRLLSTEQGGARMSPGAGPRHLAWHPSGRALFVLNELTSSVSVLSYDAARGALEPVQTVPARTAGASGENTGAEVAVSSDGRFLYASNRGDDNLAVFQIDTARLTLRLAGHVSTGGRTPRNFAIDPSGRWLIAANQDSDSLVVFHLDPATGLPARVGEAVSVPEPVCILFAGR